MPLPPAPSATDAVETLAAVVPHVRLLFAHHDLEDDGAVDPAAVVAPLLAD